MSVDRELPRGANRAEAILAILVVGILVLMLLPLPALFMDVLLAANISLSLLLLCVALYLRRPLDFSVFPTMLLLATLLRLGLNVATTRLILLRGHEGTAAAGRVIETFGDFVVGGNFVVGAIVFFILVIINFVVITKGSGRVAEVAARFTLDAMPGKQMAIDAELASGAIDEQEAIARRRRIEQESDFYGAMDGSSKFVRGDAIAGLLITVVNIVGGLIVGVAQQSMDVGEAARSYTLLTIGDGLVSQIPALMVSTAAGVVVTRAASSGHLAAEITSQMTGSRRSLRVIAALLFVLALIPGMPTVVLFLLAGGAWWLSRVEPGGESGDEQAAEPQLEEPVEHIRDMLPVDALELELGYGLVRLVNPDAQPDAEAGRLDGDGDLLQRVKAVRRQFALDLGFIVPPVHIHDNLRLQPETYSVLLRGVEIGRGELMPDRLMAMGSGQESGAVDGVPGTEPAFGMDALWIEPADRERAEAAGYTVVNCATIVTTHLTELIRRHAPELLGRQEVQELIDVVGRDNPRLVEDLVPNTLSLGEIVRVLKALLAEEVSIRDLGAILETLADEAPATREPLLLADAVRLRLARSICQRVADDDGTLHVVLLDNGAEQEMRSHLVHSERGAMLSIDLGRIRALALRLQTLTAASPTAPLLVTSADLRRPCADLLSRYIPQLSVLSHQEVQPRSEVRTLGVLSFDESSRNSAAFRNEAPAAAPMPS